MQSRQAKAKLEQCHKRESICCGNCIHISFDRVRPYPGSRYETDKNIRCSIGNFKVGKSEVCSRHQMIRLLFEMAEEQGKRP